MPSQLLLQFSAAGQLFVIESTQIVEIIPLVELTQVPSTANYIAGIFNYRGDLIPVIDISFLLFQKPAKELICTRIIITETEHHENKYYTAIIAEKVNQTITACKADMKQHNLANNDSPYIRNVFKYNNENIQLIDINKLVPARMTELEQAVNN